MFLLVPAHPGFPGQIPQSRKTVVCVCLTLATSHMGHAEGCTHLAQSQNAAPLLGPDRLDGHYCKSMSQCRWLQWLELLD